MWDYRASFSPGGELASQSGGGGKSFICSAPSFPGRVLCVEDGCWPRRWNCCDGGSVVMVDGVQLCWWVEGDVKGSVVMVRRVSLW